MYERTNAPTRRRARSSAHVWFHLMFTQEPRSGGTRTIYMRSLLGWLQTRLAKNTFTYIIVHMVSWL